MRDLLIPEKKIMAIQEQLSVFIVEQVLDPKGEFYYDGLMDYLILTIAANMIIYAYICN